MDRDGFCREVFVTKWINVKLCSNGFDMLRECLDK